MTKPCTLYLVRHGQSESNRDHVLAGQFDSPLTVTGEEQARQTKKLLETVHFDCAYSSDLQRAANTGAIVYGQLIPAERQLVDLRERNYGKMQGQSTDEFRKLSDVYDARYGSLPLTERWEHSYADYIENNGALADRFINALKGIAGKHMGKTVLVATHGGCVRMLLISLGYAKESELSPGSFHNGGYVKVACDGVDFKVEQTVGVQKQSNPTD